MGADPIGHRVGRDLYGRIPPLDRRWVPAWDFLPAAGFALQVASVALVVAPRRSLKGFWSGRVEIQQGHELIQAGPYSLVRHPIYSGVLGMFLGTALIVGEWHSLAGLGLMLLAYRRKIRIEEDELRHGFGDEVYEEYRRKAGALIPRLRRREAGPRRGVGRGPCDGDPGR